MSELGKRNPDCGLDAVGLKTAGTVRYNFGPAALYEEAIRRGEARLTAHGALVAETGQHTGRSAKDKFVVRDADTEPHVWWDANKAMAPAQFDLLLADFLAHAAGKDLYVQDLVGGADAELALPVRVVTELAWHSLFIRNLLIRPDAAALRSFVPKMTIIDLPSFKADPARHGTRSETVIALDLTRMIVLIGGTSYAGEMKKSVFTALNYLLPEQGVMPMHCSANEGPAGDAAIFFGLSGTGKTTLSADPSRTLIGDDEHGWGPHGVFNFEGGCYAKTIRLSAEAEPEIFATTQRFGTVLENVVLDENGVPDFDDGSRTENTRCAYPLDFIPNASATGRAAHTLILEGRERFLAEYAIGGPINEKTGQPYGTTTKAFAEANPNTVKAFVAASLKGWAYAVANPAEAAEIVYKYGSSVSPEHHGASAGGTSPPRRDPAHHRRRCSATGPAPAALRCRARASP